MAARIRKGTKTDPWPEKVRERIKSSMLVNALSDHVLGNNDMKPTQITAALGLLRKVLPDLSATELSGEVARPTVIRAPKTVADSKTWLDSHGPARIQPDKPAPAPPLGPLW